MKENPSIDNIEIFEWYDGLVLGLSCAGNICFLTCLLAFNPDTQKKRYLLASLSQEQTKLLRNLFQERGVEAFDKSVLSNIVTNNANLYLTFTEPEKGKTATLTRINANQQIQLHNLSFPLIDDAVAPKAISQWLND